MRPLNIFTHRRKVTGKSNIGIYLKLRSYFILAFILIVLLPFLSFGILTYLNYKNTYQENTNAISLESLNHVSSTVQYILDGISFYSGSIASKIESSETFKEKVLKHLVNSTSPSAMDLEALKVQLDDSLNISKNEQMPIANIYIVTQNQIFPIYSTGTKKAVVDPSTYDRWYKTVENAPENAKLTGTNMRFYSDGSYLYVISFIKAIKNASCSNIIPGILLIDIQYSSIAQAINSVKTARLSNGEIYLTDGDNNVMYSSNTALLTTELDESISGSTKDRNSGFFTIRLSGKNYHIDSGTIPSWGWKVFNLIPSTDVLKHGFFMRNYIFLLILLCLLIIIVFTFVIKLIFLNPINELSTAVFSPNRNSYAPEINTGREENKSTAKQAESSLSDIQSLIHRVYSTKLEQKETQLKSLQSQINPHFLYNTLESIRGAALFHGIPGIAEMSRCLSSLFRYSISSELLVPIKSEIQNIEEYISIQNFRHDNKFDLSYNISEKLYDYRILKLTLQPIVENSIKHGLEMKLGRGRVRISILSLDNTLRIEVSDDGLGISPEKIRELNRKLSEGLYSEENIQVNPDMKTDKNIVPSNSTGIGLQNVNSRIKLYFGDQYGIAYKESSIGAIVEITLPSITDSQV